MNHSYILFYIFVGRHGFWINKCEPNRVREERASSSKRAQWLCGWVRRGTHWPTRSFWYPFPWIVFFFFFGFQIGILCIHILRLCFCKMELGFGNWDWIGDIVFYCFQVVLRSSCLLSFWGCLCHMEFLFSRFGLFWEGYAKLSSWVAVGASLPLVVPLEVSVPREDGRGVWVFFSSLILFIFVFPLELSYHVFLLLFSSSS